MSEPRFRQTARWIERVAASAVMLLFVLVASASGQSCELCKHEGIRPCRKHKVHQHELEKDGIRCSEFFSCEVCAGTGYFDCAQCESLEERSEWKSWKRQFDRNQAWLKKVREDVDGRMKMDCLTGESEHFFMVWMIPKIKIGRRMVKQHELMHIYLKRMEEHRADYLEVFQMRSGTLAPKIKLFVWNQKVDQLKASAVWTESTNENGVKLYGPNPVYTTYYNRAELRDDDAVHRHLVHNVAQLLLSSQKPAQWIGHIKGGWVDEGLAHWFENRGWNICDNYCYVEVNTMQGFKGGKYKPAIRQLVIKDKTIPVQSIVVKNTDTLSPQEHAQSFSYVDFLIDRDPQKFVQLVTQLKKKVPTRTALQKVYSLNIFEFERQWKDWVKKTYPPR